ncbi:C4-dicarboxylate transporter, DctM subunit [Desulforamulus putei DSM 12395]|uniref:C4-dicarboxylate transporter, DctM subunit n=1 Tax=Desulforamulus putei DSM 12395 TaxID=1121429 RepID=A0A1M5BZ38_9FIRM|nr:C4-dicarboxylate transporter, DctM subunit [Desulforamulus putei DSM 12395]
MVAQVLFGSFAAFLVFNVPIGIALGLACILAFLVSGAPLTMLAQGMITSVDSFPLMAVPFFILAGDLMGKGGISKRLLAVADVLVGRFPGGLAMVTVATCMFFGAISGSGPATVAAIGMMIIPEMVKAGYDKKFAAAVVAASGTIGVMIPPSIPMVIYGVSTNASIGDLFISGILPGILVGLFLMAWCYIYAKKTGLKGSEQGFTLSRLLRACNDAKWALLVPVIILGGIYGGVFTPTEAAVIAVVYGFIAGVFIYRELKITEVPSLVASSALTTATVLIIVGTATTFGRLLALEQIPTMLANAITNFSQNPIIVLLLINLLLLIVGTFMDTLAAIIILAPILLPVALKFGVDPIHFGAIMVVNLAIGFITPPLGVNLFVANGISGVSLEKLSRAIMPFFAVLVLALMLITYIPEISMGLINMMK